MPFAGPGLSEPLDSLRPVEEMRQGCCGFLKCSVPHSFAFLLVNEWESTVPCQPLSRQSLRHIGLQPFELFSQLDVPVPGILGQPVAFPGEDEKAMRNVERLESPLHCYPFQIAYSHVCPTLYEVGGRFDLVELEQGRFGLVES